MPDETIYRSLCVQGRGELRRELAAVLRAGRAVRLPHGQRARGMVTISERPAAAADLAVPGHWEGDVVLGRDGKSAIGTLVERSTRFVVLLHLPGRWDAIIEAAMTAQMMTLPAQLHRAFTQNKLASSGAPARFGIAAGIPVYFSDPDSPWLGGSNESTNGLLRQYFPKDTSLPATPVTNVAQLSTACINAPSYPQAESAQGGTDARRVILAA